MHLDDVKIDQPPAVRGFWTDEDLLRASGLTSVALLKKLQLAGLAGPKHVPIPGGGRRRAWPLADVARVELAVKIAEGTGISVQAIAALLVRAGVRWVDRAADINDQVETYALDKDLFYERAQAVRTHGTRIILVGVTEAWREDEIDSFSIISSGMKLSGSTITVPRERSMPSPQRGHLSQWHEPVMTIIELAAIYLSVFDQARQDVRALK